MTLSRYGNSTTDSKSSRTDAEPSGDTHPTVALVWGFWGQNIGNAFFNLGGSRFLADVFGAGEVAHIQDQPGYRTFNNQAQGNPKPHFDLIGSLDVDYIVLQGPLLTRNLPALWAPSLNKLTRRGTRLVILSAGLFEYSATEVATARSFLAEFPPALISTRDRRTYEALQGLDIPCFDGVDSAFWAPKAFNPPGMHTEEYISLVFDQYPEPKISIDEFASNRAVDDGSTSFVFRDRSWHLNFGRFRSWLSEKGKWQGYISHLSDPRRGPSKIGPYSILRPQHRTNPFVRAKVYGKENAVVSDEPYTYLTAYAHTELTISDRVHACVATLAYGNHAMLHHPTPRAYLLDRVGASQIRSRPQRIDSERLESEYCDQLAFFRDVLT